MPNRWCYSFTVFSDEGETLKMDCFSLSPQVFIYREYIANVCVLHSDNSRATKCHEQTRMNRYPRQTARVAHFSPVVLKNRKRKASTFSAQTRFVHDMWNSQLRALFVLHWILTPLKDAWYSKGKVFIIFHQNIWTFSDFVLFSKHLSNRNFSLSNQFLMGAMNQIPPYKFSSLNPYFTHNVAIFMNYNSTASVKYSFWTCSMFCVILLQSI